MELGYMNALPLGGFNYDNCLRNQALEKLKGGNDIKTLKTGTTICGLTFKVSTRQIVEVISFGYRMESSLLLIRDQQAELLLVTNIVKNFTSWLPTFTVQEPVQLLIVTMSLK